VLERALKAACHYPPDIVPYDLELDTPGVQAARQLLKERVEKPQGRPSYDPKKSLVHVDDHLAQLCLHVDCWDGVDLYHQWFVFDDLWAGAHPDLANALLRYARTWDVLSPGRPSEED
jgi:hypothetical protein